MPGAGQDIWRPCLPWPMGFFALVGGLGERVLLLTHSSGQPVESVFAGLYESLCSTDGPEAITEARLEGREFGAPTMRAFANRASFS